LEQADVVAAHDANHPDTRQEVIPRVIHQIFHNWKDPGNTTLPPDWQKQRQTCIDLHEGWEIHVRDAPLNHYRHRMQVARALTNLSTQLWDESRSRQFLLDFYPWFVPTYDAYAYPVQRIDSLRYFLLFHHGGLYVDLDNGCQRSLEPLLYYPALVIDPGHGTLMNNVLGAAPRHPFWELVIRELERYQRWWYVLPFVDVMWGAGQWMETQVWEEYHRVVLPARRRADWKDGNDVDGLGDGDGELYRLMRDTRPGAPPPLFFTQGRGRSWDDWDKVYLEWMGDHIVLVLFGGLALGVGSLAMLARCCCLRRATRRDKEYALLGS
jgi:hypothetical protein